MDNYTALVVLLNNQSEEVQAFRKGHVHKPGVEIPPHISIFYPFLPVSELTTVAEERIQRIVNECFPIAYRLVEFGVFEEAGVLYLKPHPDEAFLELFEKIGSAFPGLESAFDPPVMHLTLSHSESESGYEEIKKAFLGADKLKLPIPDIANGLELYEKRSGIWKKVKEYGSDPVD